MHPKLNLDKWRDSYEPGKRFNVARSAMMRVTTILIYGGAFDPPHYGHLKTAVAIQNHLHFEKFLFLPCKTAVLKKASLATPRQRMHMLRLALQEYPQFQIDTREIKRDSPSYMVETLISFRQEFGPSAAITLCLGTDAFLQLPHWHASDKLLTLAHLLVITRATFDMSAVSNQMKQLLTHHQQPNATALLTQPFGSIYYFDAGQYPISSSTLRHQLQTGQNTLDCMPKNVEKYIKLKNIYSAGRQGQDL